MTTTTTAPLPDALTLLNQMLDQAGLGSLAQLVWSEFTQGISPAQIAQDIRASDTYKARFPAMQALSQQGMAISEADYINLERSYTSTARAYGLPTDFYATHAELGQFIAGQVSPAEFEARVKTATNDVNQADPQVRTQLANLYGIDQGHLTAYFLDPTNALPILQTRVSAAQAGAAATETGFGQLSRQQAETLAQLGVSQGQERSGFTQLAGLNLQTGLPGETKLDTDVLLGAEFGGDQADQQQLQAAVGQRRSAFGGGDVAASGAGALGLGKAAT